MNNTVIRVENLSKEYRLGDIGHGSLHRDMQSWWAGIRGKDDPNSQIDASGNTYKDKTESFWALKDVSFDVRQGEVLGIIGRNGAGKSTLLKILSRVTAPTSGTIKIKGRIASLLEVGTGFHPELSGRDNIYLNGTILGMKKREIDAKFDEIVKFAEVEKFIDTPVKRYSSGMYVRLAFAVAAHLEPEILIIDEVLAVGDAAFQKKCLGKMGEVAKEGRTVLFVSHNMAAIENLCTRTIVLGAGEIQYEGITKSAVSFYLNDLEKQINEINISNLKRSGTGDIKLTGFFLQNTQGNILKSASCGEEVILVFQYELMNDKKVRNISLGFSIHDSLGSLLSIFYSDYMGTTFSYVPQKGIIKCTIKDFPFSTGRYYVGVRILANGIEADWPSTYVGYIDVEAGDFYDTGIGFHSGIGSILIRADWKVEPTQELSL